VVSQASDVGSTLHILTACGQNRTKRFIALFASDPSILDRFGLHEVAAQREIVKQIRRALAVSSMYCTEFRLARSCQIQHLGAQESSCRSS